MGWASGADVLESVWDDVKAFIPQSKRLEVATALAATFAHADCDTIGEVGDPIFIRAEAQARGEVYCPGEGENERCLADINYAESVWCDECPYGHCINCWNNADVHECAKAP